MPRYHINPQTGNPGVCQAKKKCPFGDIQSEHYDSKEEARAAFEKKMKQDGSSSKRMPNYKLFPGRYASLALITGAQELEQLHPEHAKLVVIEAMKINDFNGAQNHITRFEVDLGYRDAIIHYGQRRTYFHQGESLVDSDKVYPLTKVIKEPDSVPNPESSIYSFSGRDLQVMRNAVLGNFVDAERRYKIIGRMESGKHTSNDRKEVNRALKLYGMHHKGKASQQWANNTITKLTDLDFEIGG